MKTYNVGILGATGAVGREMLKVLEERNFPVNELRLLASERSVGKKVTFRGVEIEIKLACHEAFEGLDIVLGAASNPVAIEFKDDIVKAGAVFIDNSSAFRLDEDVPLVVPEINGDDVFKNKGVISNPNCSTIITLMAVKGINKLSKIQAMNACTYQATSGAGYPGVPSFDMIDNIVPYIGGEEEKTEKECLKILGKVDGDKITNAEYPVVSSTCTRVPVIDGHTACVSLEFDLPEDKKPSLEEIEKVWTSYTSLPQELKLPSAPEHPIVVRHEENRPQPRRDRETEKGMACVIGRLRPCNVFDVKFVALSHNTKRGAAMGGILNAELLKAKGFFDNLQSETLSFDSY